MKITLIRHGKVNMNWEKRYTSAEYDAAWKAYDDCDIFPIEDHLDLPPDAKVFVTPFKRTQETARQFLGAETFEIIDGLANEVPLRSYKDSNRRRSPGYMNFRGRLQWYFRSKRQEELPRETKKRAEQLISYLESRTDNAVLVMHGFYLRIVVAVLISKGYLVTGRPRFKVPNLIVVDAVKNEANRK